MSSYTWGQAFDYTWATKWKRTRSAKTITYNNAHILHYAGRSLPLTTMAKAGWWQLFIAELQDGHLSNATINRVISVGSTAIKWTAKAELHNVTWPKNIDRLKEGDHRLTYFTKEQVARMAFVAVDIYDRQDLADALMVSAYTGVRQGELLKLKAEDVDLANNVLWIGGKPGRVTKGNNVRAVFIHELIQPVLQNRLARPYLFRDDWTNKDQLYRAFVKVRKFCGHGDDYVWHSLRHSFGTWLGETTHPRTIMELMGHGDIETSLNYVKPTDQACRSAISSL
jgi:integrase